MSVKTIAVPVSEKAYDLTQHLAAYVKVMKAVVADGFQPILDFPAILQATIKDGIPAFQDLPALGLEKDENLIAFLKALSVGSVDIGVAALS